MDRSKRLLTAALLGTPLAGVGGCLGSNSPRRRELPARPSIVLIVADDLGYGDVGAYGQQRVATPHIDALARDGIRFTQHYAGSPICAPSRAALLTGKHCGHAQIRGNLELGDFSDAGERGQMPLDAGTPTLASHLRDAGYRTAVIGKWGLGGPGSTGVPQQQGFDYFFGYLDQKQAHNYYPTHLWENERRVALDNRFFVPHADLAGTSARAADYRIYLGTDYAPDRLRDKATQFIEHNAQRPFFLLYTPTLPHAPLQVPDVLLARHLNRWPETPLEDGGYTPHPHPRAARAALISRLDDEVGELCAQLERCGIADDTVVLFTTDNGPSSEGGEDLAFFNATAGLRGQKRDTYEGGIRVPLIVRWPVRIARGPSSEQVCANWDLFPTLAQIGGAPSPSQTDGLSLLPTLVGRGSQQQHAYLYWEFHEASGPVQAVRAGRWKAVRFQPAGYDPGRPIELYDLDEDRWEKRDASARHPEVVARMAVHLNARVASPQRGFNFDPDPLG